MKKVMAFTIALLVCACAFRSGGNTEIYAEEKISEDEANNKAIELSFFPGGTAEISIPVFKISLGLVNSNIPSPPLNSVLKTLWNSFLICSNVSLNLSFIISSISLITFNNEFIDVSKSDFLNFS